MWDVLRGYPGNVLLGGGARLIEGMVFTIYAIFPLTYLANVSRIPRSTVLAAITLAAFVLILTIPLASRVADRTSRRTLFVIFSLLNGFAMSTPLPSIQSSLCRFRARNFHREVVAQMAVVWSGVSRHRLSRLKS